MVHGLKAYATVRGSAVHRIPGLSRDNKYDPSVRTAAMTESFAHSGHELHGKPPVSPDGHGTAGRPVPTNR